MTRADWVVYSLGPGGEVAPHCAPEHHFVSEGYSFK